MKKFFGVFLLFCLLFCSVALTSCEGNGAPPPFPLSLPLSCTVRFASDGAEREYELTFTGESLLLRDKEGFVFRTGKEDCALIFGDLCLPLPRACAPDKGLLFDALSVSGNEGLLKSERANGQGETTTVYTLVGDVQNFVYETDGAGKLIRVDGEGAFMFSARFDG